MTKMTPANLETKGTMRILLDIGYHEYGGQRPGTLAVT